MYGPAAGGAGPDGAADVGGKALRGRGPAGPGAGGAHRGGRPLDGCQRLHHHPTGPGAQGSGRRGAGVVLWRGGNSGRPAHLCAVLLLHRGTAQRRGALRHYGGSVRDRADVEVGGLYPPHGADHLPDCQPVPQCRDYPPHPEAHPGAGGHCRPAQLHDPHVQAGAGGPGRRAEQDQRHPPGQPHRPARHPEGAEDPGQGHQRHAGPGERGLLRADAVRL